MAENHDKPSTPAFERPASFIGMQYYAELNRIIAILFAGVLALMTFLLTVGYQRPHVDFSYALYTTIVVLGLNLVAYVIGHMMFVQAASHKGEAVSAVADEADTDKDKDKDKEASKSVKAAKSAQDAAKSRLRVMRMVQQVLFVIAVCAIVWLALATAHFFFTIPTTPSTSTGQ